MMTSEKQARLDCYELREKFPVLRARNFFAVDLIAKARRASVALHNADVNTANTANDAPAKRAERRALRIIAELRRELGASPDAIITETGYGFRFVQIRSSLNSYDLI